MLVSQIQISFTYYIYIIFIFSQLWTLLLYVLQSPSDLFCEFRSAGSAGPLMPSHKILAWLMFLSCFLTSLYYHHYSYHHGYCYRCYYIIYIYISYILYIYIISHCSYHFCVMVYYYYSYNHHSIILVIIILTTISYQYSFSYHFLQMQKLCVSEPDLAIDLGPTRRVMTKIRRAWPSHAWAQGY